MKNTLLGLKHFGSESHNAANITANITNITKKAATLHANITKKAATLHANITKKAATGPNGPIFNRFPVYWAANGLDLNYIGPGFNYGGPLTSLLKNTLLHLALRKGYH